MGAQLIPDVRSEQHRAHAMASPAGWAWFTGRGDWQLTRHLSFIAKAVLTCIAEGGRLLLEAPPRHGKSDFMSRRLPAWYAGAFPGSRVVVASYSETLPRRHGRLARADFDEFGPQVFGQSVKADTSAATDWATTHGSEFFGIGVGGGFTGRGFNLLLLDDLVKDAEAANSEVQREALWDWLETVALTRAEPKAAVIGMTTRWHEDDAHGRLLGRQPGRWKRIRLPAVAEADDVLGRKPGEALWPERFPVDVLEEIRTGMSARNWAALYQQAPTPAGGDVYRSEWWEDSRYDLDAEGRYIVDGHAIPLESLRRYCVVDLATSTKTTADYTVIGTFGVIGSRILWLDTIRARMEGPDILPRLRGAMSRWGCSLAWIEDAGYQLSLIQQARRLGMPVRTMGRKEDAGLRVEGDKVALAYSATPFIEQGRVWLPRSAPWLAQAEAEILSFPNAQHDDVADVFAYGVRIGAEMGRRGGTTLTERRLQEATTVAKDLLGVERADPRRVFA